MSWHTLKAPFSRDAAVQADLEARAAAALSTMKNGVPLGFGIFKSERGGMGDFHFFFPPEAKAIAVSCGATPCQKPESARGWTLVAGQHSAMAVHFPVGC